MAYRIERSDRTVNVSLPQVVVDAVELLRVLESLSEVLRGLTDCLAG
jgi:hypothetical protein